MPFLHTGLVPPIRQNLTESRTTESVAYIFEFNANLSNACLEIQHEEKLAARITENYAIYCVLARSEIA